jgi:hypothetical protein
MAALLPKRCKGRTEITLFDFTFGLSAVILGLALTQLASSLHRLAIAGRRVRWAPEPILLSAIILLVIVSVWLFQWPGRGLSETTIGLMVLQVVKLLLPFLAAAFVYPDQLPEQGEVDLLAHYNLTRAFTFGSLIAGLVLFQIYYAIQDFRAGRSIDLIGDAVHGPWPFIAAYSLLIFIRARWFNILVLTTAFLFYAWEIMPITLRQ